MAKKEKSAKITAKVNATDYVAKNGYPEVGQFDEQKALQKFYKQLETEQLEEWAGIEGLEFKACPEQPMIHRMRVAMAILYKHFPKEPSKTKKESKYAKYSLEDLVNLAVENDVAVETTDDDRIMRMRLIMALRVAKVVE
jgi:coproporphyrinogen III oxidase-like Fe-S oxidoreductase